MYKNISKVMSRLSPKTLLILAFIVSFTAFLLIYSYLNNMTEENSASKVVPVVVAAVDIPEKTVISANMVKIVMIPKELAQEGAFDKIESAEGVLTKVSITANEQLTPKRLAVDGKVPGFIGKIPDDKRAIAIGITDITGVAGFANPGDYVDVMVIGGKENNQISSGKILLQNVLVLAVNKKDAASNSDDKNKDKTKVDASADKLSTATLAVDPDEAVKLAVAQQQGSLYLVLRPFQPANRFVLSGRISMDHIIETYPAAVVTPPLSEKNAVQSMPTVPVRNSYIPPATDRQEKFTENTKTISVIRGTDSKAQNVK